MGVDTPEVPWLIHLKKESGNSGEVRIEGV